MKKLIAKELKLAASPLSYFFIAAAFLTFAPGYPILLGTFFTTLGIFYSFQAMRENNDIYYTILLPVAKADVVRAKFAFSILIEVCSFLLMTAVTLIRMTLLKDSAVYAANALMCANLTFLGFALTVFGLFNFIFVRGFFKTAYAFGKPFVTYIIAATLPIIIAEALHFIPGLEALNEFGFGRIGPQASVFCAGLVLFLLLTFLGIRDSVNRFEKLDL